MQIRLFVLAILAIGLIDVATPTPTNAQSYSQNSVYVELGGNGLFYSVNYDRRFTNNVSGRFGFMIFGGQSEQATDDQIGVGIFPVTANYLVGTGSHRLELGVGPVLMVAGGDLEEYGTVSAGGIAGVTSTFGYRYQPMEGGFLFRIGLTPFYSDGRPQLWAGLSLGYAF